MSPMLIALSAVSVRGFISATSRQQHFRGLVRAAAPRLQSLPEKAAEMVDAEVLPSGQKLCIVDGHGLAYRMHFALQKSGMSTVAGEPTHALQGFCSKLIALHELFPDHRMVVAWDRPEPTFRSAELPSYKAQRPSMPDQLRHQMSAMVEACALFGAPSLEAPGYEADDIIAACVAEARYQGFSDVTVVAQDKDLLQLVSSDDADPTRVGVWDDKKKVLLDAAAVEAKHGVRPSQMGDLLALMGDSSDNVPGVPGVGPKGAAKLLVDHHDLEGVLSAALTMKKSKRTTALVEHAEMARRARRLVQLDADAPFDRAAIVGAPMRFDGEGIEAFFRRWELYKVQRNVEKLRRRIAAQRKAGVKAV